MMHLLKSTIFILSISLLIACGDEPAADHDHAGHDHDAHDHSAHNHAAHPPAQDDGHNHGTEHHLGTLQIAADSFKVTQFGDIAAGGEAVFAIQVVTSSVKEIRAWIGSENGRGSVKALLAIDKNLFHGHIEVPKTLTTESKLWIEFTNSADSKVSGSIPLETGTSEKHDHGHDHSHDHGDHKH
ncbi:MAG: hypothetical protein HRU15_08745 [Planctomycetes bacterium]|nr:hypothetical protein [Planctomycetota bacterium]